MSVQVSGDGVSEIYNIMAANPVYNTAAPGGGPILTALIAGNNTIVVPPGSIAMMLIPPSTSTNAKVLKGISGDTGFALAPNLPALLPLPTGTTSVIVNAVLGENVNLLWL